MYKCEIVRINKNYKVDKYAEKLIVRYLYHLCFIMLEEDKKCMEYLSSPQMVNNF